MLRRKPIARAGSGRPSVCTILIRQKGKHWSYSGVARSMFILQAKFAHP